MEEAIYLIATVVSIAVTICFFVLCSNVSKIKKSIRTDFDEYLIHKKIGDKQKAYYYLQRDFVFSDFGYERYVSDYYKFFKKLGLGIPDFEEFNKLKEEDDKKEKETTK